MELQNKRLEFEILDDNDLQYLSLWANYIEDNMETYYDFRTSSSISQHSWRNTKQLIISSLNPDLFVVKCEGFHPLKGIIEFDKRLTLQEYFERCNDTERYGSVYIDDLKRVLVENNLCEIRRYND